MPFSQVSRSSQSGSSLDDFKDTNNWNHPILLNPNTLGVNFTRSGMEDPTKLAAALPKAGFEEPELWAKSFMRGRACAFATQFGETLKLRTDARGLATKVLTNLVEEYKLEVDIKAPILDNAFWGVHLRTEKDALEGPPVAGKNKLYPTYGMQLVYVASGDPDVNFWKDAKSANLTVLVDLMVLAKASEFLGVGHSGFNWSVAGRRQVSIPSKSGTEVEGVSNEEGTKENQKMTGGGNGEVAFADGLSVLYGAKGEGQVYKACLWP
ncbi:uncharacterized protein PAC_08624 [Phialocephala subalpina]|uniref:Uncharacterized protein n=1 Tax=Phialocephala subalpina TaxID=576137 RepID=A0A1L7X142_9HELO|nr:uncharacterized protein PAC_08624 [Phialocephala subalpina]